MTSNERAQHDWFDQELDRLLADMSSDQATEGSDPDHELVQAAVQMQRLDLHQQSEPDDRFIRDLEIHLMPNVSYLAASRNAITQNPIRTIYEQLVSRITIERTQHRRTSRLASAFSIALLFAVIAATTFVAINSGDNGSDTPTASSALATGEAAEPTPTVAIVMDRGSTPTFDDADWSYKTAGMIQRIGSMAFGNGKVYRLVESDTFSGVESVDALSGEAGWQYESTWDGRGLAADDDGIYFVSSGAELVSISPEDGTQRWTATLPASVVSFTLQDGVLYVWDESATMTAIRSSDGSSVWQKVTGDPGGPQQSNPDSTAPDVVPVVMSNDEGDTLAMVSANGNINSFSKTDGNIWWSLRGFDSTNTRMSITYNNVMFVLSQRVPGDPTSPLRGYGINVNSGQVNWEIDIDGGLTQPSIYADDGGMIYVIGDSATTPGADLFVEPTPYVDNDSGRNPWTSDVAPQQTSGDGTGGMRIYGINSSTGAVKWITNSKVGPWVALVRGCQNSCDLSGITSDGYVASINRGGGGVSGQPITFNTSIIGIIDGGQVPDGSSYGKFASFPDGTIIGFGYMSFSEMG